MEKKKPGFIHQPEYPGGPKELTKFLYAELRYPEAALSARVEGTVVVSYDVDHRGFVTDARVLQGIGHGCDEEACRVVRLLKFDVERNRGVKVVFHKKAQVRFKLPKLKPAPATVQVQYNYVAAPSPAAAEKKGESFSYTVKLAEAVGGKRDG
jgi:protein TonB